jgi:hypothetical protein
MIANPLLSYCIDSLIAQFWNSAVLSGYLRHQIVSKHFDQLLYGIASE